MTRGWAIVGEGGVIRYVQVGGSRESCITDWLHGIGSTFDGHYPHEEMLVIEWEEERAKGAECVPCEIRLIKPDGSPKPSTN